MQPPLFTKIAIRLAAAAGLLIALAYLFSRAFVPSGRLTVVNDFVKPAPYLSMAKPTERLGPATKAADGTSRVPLIGSPLFIDMTPPAGFKEATLTLAYENAGHPTVEFGALISAIDQQYGLQPVEQRVIDELPWKHVKSGALTLYQRGNRYVSVDEFLRNPPSLSSIATYRAAVPVPYRLDGYEPTKTPRTVTVSVRGHARMLTYVKDEDLSFSFSVQDMNRLLGADPVTVSVYRGTDKEPISRTVLPDDGNTNDDQKSSGLRDIPVTVTAPSEGYYKIEFTSTADVFIRGFTTPQRKLVFVDDLYLGDHVGYSPTTDPITVYTDGGRLAARTPHAEAVQDLRVGEQAMRLDQPNVRYEHDLPGGGALTAITTSKRSVLLQTVGLFALSPEDYFNPLPYAVQWHTSAADLEARGIEYVLSSYEPPVTDAMDSRVKVAKIDFDLTKLARTETGAYRFVIEAPGIEETHYELLLKSLTVSLRREPMTLTTLVPNVFDAFRPEPQNETGIVVDGRTYGEWPE